jgi:hypothetical protein
LFEAVAFLTAHVAAQSFLMVTASVTALRAKLFAVRLKVVVFARETRPVVRVFRQRVWILFGPLEGLFFFLRHLSPSGQISSA